MFLGRVSSDINDFRSNESGSPVIRAASGTRIRWAIAGVGGSSILPTADGGSSLRAGPCCIVVPALELRRSAEHGRGVISNAP